MQVAVANSTTPAKRLTARRVNFNTDPSIEIAAAFKAACKAVVTTEAEAERIADTVPDEWFSAGGFFKMPHVMVAEADSALFDNHQISFNDDADVDARLPKLARKYCKDGALLARLPEIAADLKAKIAAFNAEREPVLEASGLKKASRDYNAAREARNEAAIELLNATPTTARGAQAILSAMVTALKASEKDRIGFIRTHEVSRIVRNVSAFIGGGSR